MTKHWRKGAKSENVACGKSIADVVEKKEVWSYNKAHANCKECKLARRIDR